MRLSEPDSSIIHLIPARAHAGRARGRRGGIERLKYLSLLDSSSDSSTTVPVDGLVVAAYARGNSVVLLDRTGRRIATLDSGRLGPLDATSQVRLRWREAVGRMAALLSSRALQKRDPWSRRAESLAGSFNKRRYDRDPLGGRARFEKYKTRDWEAASHRLMEQITNKYRVRSRSGWQRWSYTVSNNQAKRAVAYERRREDLSKAGDGDGGTPAVPLRDQRSGVDSRDRIAGSHHSAVAGGQA